MAMMTSARDKHPLGFTIDFAKEAPLSSSYLIRFACNAGSRVNRMIHVAAIDHLAQLCEYE